MPAASSEVLRLRGARSFERGCAVREHAPMTFTRMDESTAEQWQHIISETMAHQPRVAERVLAMLASLEDSPTASRVDQLTHSLQTATRAEEARRRRGGRGGLAVPRHRQGGLGAQPPRHRGRDPAAVRESEAYQMIARPPGLPGAPLLRVPRKDPDARERTGARPGTRWPSSSPTTGTRRASTPTTPPRRSTHFEPLRAPGLRHPRALLSTARGATSGASVRTDPEPPGALEESRRRVRPAPPRRAPCLPWSS